MNGWFVEKMIPNVWRAAKLVQGRWTSKLFAHELDAIYWATHD